MKLFNRKKKGFTIVELVIVVAVIAVLAAILIPTFVGLVNKAHIAADDSLVRDLNNALAIDREVNGEHKTMSDALLVTDEYGFNVQRINAKANKSEILWDSENDVFCYFDGQTEQITYIPEVKLKTPASQVKDYQYFVIKKGVASSADLSDKYSTYLYQSTATTLTTTKGLDVGDETNVTSITYNGGTNAQNVIIRTNSANTTLTIDAPLDTVNHYGNVGKVDAQKIDLNHCYNEYGTAAYIKLTEGKVVAKAGGKIEVVFAANNDKDAVAVIKESQGTIERGLTVIEPVSTTNEARTNGIPLEYSIDGITAQSMSEADKTAAIAERETTVNVVAQTAIADLIDEEQAETVVRAVTSASTEYYSFKEFAQKVNAGDFDEENNITFTLMANVNLDNQEWTPIGTKEHPFKWVFDGNGYTVKNFKISSEHARGEDGLFGFVVGNPEQGSISLTARWNSSTYSFNTDNIEGYYSTIVKNLTIDGATISGTNAGNQTNTAVSGTSSTYKSTAAAIGELRYAYAENITVTNSVVNGYKTVGGIVGSLDGGSISHCKTTNSVSINGYSNVGGFVGALDNSNDRVKSQALRAIIYDCENNAVINKITADKAYGYIGGILGSGQNYGFAIVDCIVNGSINSTNSSGAAPSKAEEGAVGGVVGQLNSGGYLINCTNSSTMNIDGPHGYVGGITEYAGSTIAVNCVNNANISADAVFVAGILAGSNSGDKIFISCVNNGELTNTKANNSSAVKNISNVHGTAEIKDTEFANVAELQEALNAQNLEESKAVKLINVTVADTTDTLVLPNSVESITSDKKVCSSIQLNQDRTRSISINLPGINYEFNGSYTIWFNCPEGNITVPQGQTVSLLSVSNANSVTINGTVTGQVSVKNVGTITNNGTIGSISFGAGTVNTVFTNSNSGKITGYAGRHSVITQSQINLTVNNKGSITASEGEYALLFYGNSTITFNAYQNSTITKAEGMGALAISNGPSAHAKSMTINVASDAAGVENNKYYGIANYSSSTYDCTLVINFNASLSE